VKKKIIIVTKAFATNPLFSGSAIMLLGSLVANAMNYLYHLIMGRMLGPEDYGILASIFSLLYIVSIVPLSSSVAIVKFISGAKDKKELSLIYSSLKRFILKLAVLGLIVICLITPLLSKFLHIDNILTLLLVGPIFFLSLVTLINQSTSQGQLQFLGVVVPMSISSVFKLILSIIFVFLGFSALGAVGGVAVAALLAYFSSLYFVRGIKTVNKDYDIRPFIKYSLPVLLQALAFTSLFTIDVILVKHFFSSYDAGIYAALATLGKIIFFASSPITSVMFPIVSKRKAVGQNYLKVAILAFLINASISMSVLLVYGLEPFFVVKILYGAKYLTPAGSLLLMGLFISIYTSANFLINYLLSVGKLRAMLIPFAAALLQIIGIILWHDSLIQVIQVSLIVSILMFLSIVSYMLYNSIHNEN
jgi:O-antigen/teichoic acid export membrane protein